MVNTKQEPLLPLISHLKKHYGIALTSIIVYLAYRGTAGTSQTDMAKQLGITRTTIRAAILELELVGLVKVVKEQRKITDIMFVNLNDNDSQLGITL